MREHLYIDGFNLWYALKRSKPKDRSLSFATIRDLVYQIENYCIRHEKKATFVLDGTRYEGEMPDSPCLDIQCTSPNETADEVLERLMSQVPKPHRLNGILVSEDRALCRMAIGFGMRTYGSMQFVDDICESSRPPAKKTKTPFNNPFFDKL